MDRNVNAATDAEDRLVDTHEAAKRLGVGYRTLMNARIYGGPAAIPWITIGRSVRYSSREIDRFIRENRRSSTCEYGRR
jgi:hypothetical protein